MVTEYCKGGDLQDYMMKHGCESVGEESMKTFAKRLAEGIKYLHERNIVHRDIKPENILLHNEDSIETPVLADFEYAK